jgi:hypothetical protein
MNELARALDDPTPPPGARERVRAGIPRRLERWQRRRWLSAYAGVLAAAGIAVALAARMHDDREHDGRAHDDRERTVARTETPARFEGVPLVAGVLELPSRSRVLVADDAAVSLVRDNASGTTLRVDRGTLVANVAPRAPGVLFVVLAGDVRVEVVGTLFAVEVGADGHVGVRGVEGVVRVVSRTSETRVGPGDTWPAPELAPVVDEQVRRRVAFAAQTSSPKATKPPASERTPSTRGEHTPSTKATKRTTSERASLTAYARARQLEYAGKRDEALAAYRAIDTGAEAEDALYATARLLGGTSGRADEAHAALLRYRERYPDGRYARAVDAHIVDQALARGDLDTVVAEANRFLAAHPIDPLASRFLQSRAAVYVRRGECAAALRDLDRLPQAPELDRLRAACAK